MKKIILLTLIIIMTIFIYILLFNDIQILNWTNKSIKDIQELNQEYNTQKSKSENEAQNLEQLQVALEKMKTTDEEYQNKLNESEKEKQLKVLGIDQIWNIIEEHAKSANIILELNVMETEKKDTYDLNIITSGGYGKILEFIYKIENDKNLSYNILKFKLEPYTETEIDIGEYYTEVLDLTNVKVTFTIKDVVITEPVLSQEANENPDSSIKQNIVKTYSVDGKEQNNI